MTLWTSANVRITWKTVQGREGLLLGHGTFWLPPDIEVIKLVPDGYHEVGIRLGENPTIIVIGKKGYFIWQKPGSPLTI